MADADVAREVTAAVDDALKENRRIETTLIVILVAVAATGIGLMVLGAWVRQWTLALPGSLAEIGIAMPIRSLVKLRAENIRLKILPQMMRMADTATEKRVAFKLIDKLISQV